MHPNKLPVAISVAMTGALLLCAPASTGWARDKADHPPIRQVQGAVPQVEGAAYRPVRGKRDRAHAG